MLLAVLQLLKGREMSAAGIEAELTVRLGDEYRLERRAIRVAIAALEAERLVLPPGGDYRITAAGREALESRAGAAVLDALGGRLEEATILFTDVVGSTRLLEAVGDDAAHELRRRHFAILRRAVREHGGREVKSLGDGLMVRFASARDALACAEGMQTAVRECGDCLELRVGIASGEVVREDGDYFGRPVVVARRLCDSAGAGQVLVAGARDDALEPVGALTLKGLREPVTASALRVRPLAAVA